MDPCTLSGDQMSIGKSREDYKPLQRHEGDTHIRTALAQDFGEWQFEIYMTFKH